MTSTQRELLRNAILLAMAEAGAYALTVPVLATTLRVAGYPQITADEAKAELLYLEDKGMAERPKKTISPENAKWRITAAGRDHLAEEGLA